MVDVSYMPENPLTLDKRAIKAGVTVVPDCGVAPGLSNLLVGHALSKLDQVESIHIMVGGLPKEPVPPLGYVLTWSPTDLIDEYTRKANIIQKGRVVEVEPLTGLEEIEFPGVGKLEGFYTDGLRTLLYTIKDVKNMWEKTLRYPGHAHSIKLLETLGFFSKDPIQVDKARLTPRDVTVEVLKKRLLRPEVEDLLAMKVEVSGTAKREKKRYVYHLLDHYDRENAITAMARTTAYPASIVSRLIAKNMVKKKGLVPLEKLGARDNIFSTIMTELEKRHVKILESVQ
jgi:saccharopine dehydrogenase-like NADP-dependent oxidoreductase